MKIENISNNQHFFKQQLESKQQISTKESKIAERVDMVEISRYYDRLKNLYDIESFDEINREEIEKIFRPIGSISEPNYPPEVIKEFIDRYVIKHREMIGKIINKTI